MKKIISLFFLPIIIFAQSENSSDEPLVVSAQYDVEEVLVVGTRASLISAQDKQRASDRIISVVDSDALGEFPDTTAAESIRRLSGISIENDQGEGRYVSIRGLSSDLNAIAVNGALMPAPEGNRSVMLDGLPSELLDSIEVSKSLTPDQDADSIGGRIDFKTKRATDLEDRLVKVKFDTQYNEQSKSKDNPRFALTYGEKVNDSFGHIIGMTYSSKQIVTFNNETGYGWGTNGSGLKELNDDWEMRYYDLTRERFGLTYDADFLVGDDTSLFFNAFYNEYVDDELRWKDEYGKISQTGTTTSTSMLSSRIRHDAETRVREEVRTISSFSFGGATLINNWNVDVQISRSFAEQDDTNNADLTFRCEIRAKKDECIDLTGIDNPVGEFNFSNPQIIGFNSFYSEIYNPANLKFKELELEDSIIEDQETAFKVDFYKDITINGNDAELKFGIKNRAREVNNDTNKAFYVNDSTMADFAPLQLTWPFPGQTFSPQANPAMVFALQGKTNQLELDAAEITLEDYSTNEDIFAVYGMVTINFEQSLLVAGVRVEEMEMSSRAFDQDGNITKASKDHTFVAPSLNYKYFLNENTIVRAAVSRSLSRPSFRASAPVLELNINGTDVSGSYGNPDLEPYESNNFDLSIEYYGEDLSYISIGTFLKQIDNAIYPTIQKSATINGITFNDGVNTWVNANESDITGYEFNFQKDFLTLPSPFDGMFIAYNLTLTDGDSTFDFADGSTFTTPFRKLSEKQENFSLGYSKDKLDMRLAYNSRDDYLDWLADEEGAIDTVSLDNSRFVGPHKQWDFKLSYSFNDNFAVKFEIVNAKDRPEYYYWGKSDRLSQYDEYGTSYAIGFTYTN